MLAYGQMSIQECQNISFGSKSICKMMIKMYLPVNLFIAHDTILKYQNTPSVSFISNVHRQQFFQPVDFSEKN